MADTVQLWDFQTALAETIRERYEDQYVRVIEVSNVINRRVLRDSSNWMVTSPEVASIFETTAAGFAPYPSENFIDNTNTPHNWKKEGF